MKTTGSPAWVVQARVSGALSSSPKRLSIQLSPAQLEVETVLPGGDPDLMQGLLLVDDDLVLFSKLRVSTPPARSQSISGYPSSMVSSTYWKKGVGQGVILVILHRFYPVAFNNVSAIIEGQNFSQRTIMITQFTGVPVLPRRCRSGWPPVA